MNWEFKGKEITSIKQFPEGAVGFIYILTFSDGKRYIGRKLLTKAKKKAFDGKKKKIRVQSD